MICLSKNKLGHQANKNLLIIAQLKKPVDRFIRFNH